MWLAYARERNLERDAVADERDIMRDALKRSMGEASLAETRQQFEREVQARGFIELDRQPGAAGRVFTNQEMIDLERDNIRSMREGQNQHPALASFETRRQTENDYAHLSASQRGAVEEVLSSRDRIQALDGVAGAGKTTSLTAIRDAAEREGYHVEGFAPTSRAAQNLQEAGIQSSTLQSHLARPDSAEGHQKRLYVLDESSLASTRQVNEFLHKLKHNDRVLLVGDTRQHEAVEAGRPYSQLQEAGMKTAHLEEIIRQKDPELKKVVEQLSKGESQSAIFDLERQGRVHQIEDREERLKTIAQEYGRQPQGTLVISPDNESRRELNSLIHREMQQRGTVSEQEHKFQVLDPRQDLTGADRAWATRYEVEDVLRYSRGSKALDIHAGEYATVKAIDHERNLLTVRRESGEEVTYNPRQLQGVSVYRQAERDFAEGDRVQFTAPSREFHVANRELGTVEKTNENGRIAVHTDSGRVLDFNIQDHPHIDYGYAVTSHSGQGQTTDRVLINVDTELGEKLVNERLAYVAVSRARYDAQIYTNDQAQLAHDLSREYSHSTATDDYSQERGDDYSQDHSQEQGATTATPEHSHAEESLGDTGQSPAADAAHGQSIGIGED